MSSTASKPGTKMCQIRLDKAARIVGGATPKTGEAAFWGGPIAWATPKDLSKLESRHLGVTARTITEEGLASCAAEVLPVGSVLFSSRAPIGLTAINTVPMATNQGFKSLVPKPDVCDAGYLYQWLRGNRSHLESLGNGATFKEVSKAVVSRIEIPIPHKNGKPDLDEQKRIAAILDKADAIRRKRKQALELTDDFLRSVFLDMFGDPEGMGWSMTTVESMALPEKGSIRTGPFGSQLLHSEFVDAGIAVLGIDNAVTNEFAWGKQRFITEDKYSELERYTVKPGDVLITIMGTCGRCAVVPEDIPTAINTKHLCCITLDPKECLPEFLHAYFLMHPIALAYLGRNSKGAIMDGLNMGTVKSLPIPKVPLSHQQDFVKLSKAKSAFAQKTSNHADDSNELFSSLQQRAFRGEL